MAAGALCGINPRDFIRADYIEQYALVRIINQAQVMRQEHSRELAQMVVYELAQAMKKGKKRG